MIKTIRHAWFGAMILGILINIFNHGCKDPNDFKPPEDTLLFPPKPPNLLSPVDSYAYTTDGNQITFHLACEPVESAEVYILNLSLNGHPDTITLDSNYYVGIIDSDHFGTNTWRIRASSARWKNGYTDWTETRVFYTRVRPRPPYLYQPPYNANLTYDSMPAPVGFNWGTVMDEKFYNLEIYKDSQLLYYAVPSQCFDTIYVDDTGRYEWRARANSILWQLPGQWSDLWPFTIGLRKKQ